MKSTTYSNCDIIIEEDGKYAEIVNRKYNITVARLLIKGPLKRALSGANRGYDELFSGVVSGIGDDEYIDKTKHSIEKIKGM